MFKGFEILSGEEWASVLYQTGLKQVEYVGGAAVRNLIVGNEKEMKDMLETGLGASWVPSS